MPTARYGGLVRTRASGVPVPPGTSDEVKRRVTKTFEELSSGVAGDAILYQGPQAGLVRAPDVPDLYVGPDYRREIFRQFELKGRSGDAARFAQPRRVTPQHIRP
jgi:hypothetical protein